VGQAFGRGRPATGFSLDLRQLVLAVAPQPRRGAILSPCGSAAAAAVAELRAAGEVVMTALPGHAGTWEEAGCDRRLVLRDGCWVVAPLGKED
jgi:ATP phosphoribosyltransferase regulatory subunit